MSINKKDVIAALKAERAELEAQMKAIDLALQAFGSNQVPRAPQQSLDWLPATGKAHAVKDDIVAWFEVKWASGSPASISEVLNGLRQEGLDQGVSQATVGRSLRILVEEGKLAAVGGGPSRRYALPGGEAA